MHHRMLEQPKLTRVRQPTDQDAPVRIFTIRSSGRACVSPPRTYKVYFQKSGARFWNTREEAASDGDKLFSDFPRFYNWF